jgi:hypothetical protein
MTSSLPNLARMLVLQRLPASSRFVKHCGLRMLSSSHLCLSRCLLNSTKSSCKRQNKRGDTGRHHPYPSVQDDTTTGRRAPPTLSTTPSKPNRPKLGGIGIPQIQSNGLAFFSQPNPSTKERPRYQDNRDPFYLGSLDWGTSLHQMILYFRLFVKSKSQRDDTLRPISKFSTVFDHFNRFILGIGVLLAGL